MMTKGTVLDCRQKLSSQNALDEIKGVQLCLNSYHAPNSLEDEANELFREIAALKDKSVQDILDEMQLGTQNYLEAVNTPVAFKDGLPTGIDKYIDQLEKLSEGIESCWDIFSLESREFFINLADQFCKASSKTEGLKGLAIRLRLLIPSIKQGENLFKKYRKSFFLIPQAVDRAVNLRKKKSTLQLSETAQSLLKRIQNIEKQPKIFSPYLKHLGKDREDQIRKNQGAMALLKRRMEEAKK